MDTIICKGCNTKVVKPVVCESCGIAAHPGCVQRTGHSIANGQFSNCPNNLAGTSSEDILISKFQRMIRSEFEKFERRYLAEIEKIKTDVSAISTRVLNLEKELGALKMNPSRNLASEVNIIAEIEERKRRAANLILYNMEETDNSAPSSMAGKDPAADDALVKDIFHLINPNGYKCLKVERIGKRKDGQPRPIKVTLASEHEALSLLRRKRVYTGPVKIAQDRTSMQRQHLNLLKAELKSYKDAGDTNKTIRYINGSPRIVEIKSLTKNM